MTVNINWDHLTFSLTPTASQFVCRYERDKGWDKGEYLPFGEFLISPAASVLNYGQGLFEGMKAIKTPSGGVNLFRPEENIKRLNAGGKQFFMPEFPVEEFLTMIPEVVRRNQDYIPPFGLGALYIRPCLWGVSAGLGVKQADDYLFVVYTSPVGEYYKRGEKGVDLEVCHTATRASPQGCGHIKCIGNYAGVLHAKLNAHSRGFADCLFLDAKESSYIEEASSSNFFAVFGDTLVTPQLGSILPGITRNSILRIAKEQFKLNVTEKKITVDEALKADELFLTGTAAVVTPVATLTSKSTKKEYGDGTPGPVTQMITERLLAIQRGTYPDEFSWVVPVN